MSHDTSAPATGARTSTADMAVLRWLVGATFIVILNETIMINAIPDLKDHFHVGNGAAQWLTTAFMLTMAVVIPVTGWFLQRVTTRQAFGLAMGVFCAGTLLAAITPPSMFWLLIVARVIQASGTAVMMPLLMTTLMNVVPESDRGRVMGNVTLAMSVAPAMGPAVSGLILSSLSWRWMFLLVLPVAGAIGIVGLRKLKNVGEPTAGALDFVSVPLAALGFGSLVYGLSLVGRDDAPVSPYLLIGGGLVVLATFVWRQLGLQRGGSPLLDLRTLTHRNYTLSLLLMVIAFMGFLGSLLLMPLYLQDVRGLSPISAGLCTLPLAAMTVLCGPLSGRVVGARGVRGPLVVGGLGLGVGSLMLVSLDADTSLGWLLAAYTVFGLGFGAVNPPITNTAVSGMPPSQAGVAAAVATTSRQVGLTLGVAAIGAVATSRVEGSLREGLAAASHAAWWLIAGLGALIVALGLAASTTSALASAERTAARLQEA
jgi:MFS transporter, DHA2 family, lincomycin resistance protein